MNKTKQRITALLIAIISGVALAEPEEIAEANSGDTAQKTSAHSVLTIDASSLIADFRSANIPLVQCQNAMKEFEKAIVEANANANASRKKLLDVAQTYLRTCMDKAQASGNLDKVLEFKKALDTINDGIHGDAEEIVKLRNGMTLKQTQIDQNLVSFATAAAKSLYVVMDSQKKEATRKGALETAQTIAAFQKKVEDWAKTLGKTAPSPTLPLRSPTNIFGYTRNPSMRNKLLVSGGGNAKTEAAVMRSLRWLKSVQNPDGSWPNNKVAMTGFALLTFLAHGETPDTSTEFGETVQRAIEFLVAQQKQVGDGLFTKSGNGYAHAIATYAMCEAYGMTQDPETKNAADAGLEVIINGQHPSGGWDYNWRQTSRDDTSIMGWAAQALKAGIMADFYHAPKALERASKLCVVGFKKNGFADGGFGYTSPQKGGLTGVGTLCMQFHNAAKDPYVRNSLRNIIYGWKPEWIGYSPERMEKGEVFGKSGDRPPGAVGGACPQYYYYYGTQAVFQEGEQWKKWNERMWPSYVAAQFKTENGEPGSTCACGQRLCNTIKEPYKDDKGQFQEIGHWVNTDAHGDRPVMDTCLAALQLMTYYRYLPLSKQAYWRR